MGKGDITTKRGKIHAGTFGKSRPKKKRNKVAAAEALKEARKEEASKEKPKAKAKKKK